MTARRSREDCAIEVWVALEIAGGVGLSLPELVDETSLTKHQVKTGLREINHVKQLAQEQPIAVHPDGWRYVLPELYPELTPWMVNRVRDLLTRLEAEQTRIHAAAAKWPGEVSRTVQRQLNRLVEDLQDVLVLVAQ